jgi:hypothetical protein
MAGDEYRIKAAELHAQAQCHTTSKLRVQFENLAKAYLAEQADRNDRSDLLYEPPPPKLDSEAKR